MAQYKVPIETYQAFRNEVLGKGYDIDDAYGFQCWDGCALLWQQIGHTLDTGGTQKAKGCWLVEWARKANTVKGYFVQVTNKKDIKRGDVVVFNSPEPNGAGHIAFADEDYKVSDRINFLGQNQSANHNPVTGTPFSINPLGLNRFLGAFRFISWNGGTPPEPPEPPSKKRRRKHFPWVVAWANWDNFKK